MNTHVSLTASGDDVSLSPRAWASLRQYTPARIGLGRAGVSHQTRDVLAFSADHAAARDAIHQPLDTHQLAQALLADGWPRPIVVRSRARDRVEYLLRPDLGRRLDPDCADLLAELPRSAHGVASLVIVVGDGLSAIGVQRHAPCLLASLRATLAPVVTVMPPVIAVQARVALGDEIGQRLGATLVAMIVGERPGLSSPDSLGIYLTLNPRVGCHDAQRNCISNVRPAGQPPEVAAQRLAWLVREALRLGTTGVALKDHSGLPLIGAPNEELLPNERG